MEILIAEQEHLKGLVDLFDAYRVFYNQKSDKGRAEEFLSERMEHQESVVLIVRDEAGAYAGFTQLYPSFSSVSMKPIWILNDLYVADTHRRMGVASMLLREAAEFAKQDGAIRLVLETEVNNKNAIALYEKESWVMDKGHYYFELDLDGE